MIIIINFDRSLEHQRKRKLIDYLNKTIGKLEPRVEDLRQQDKVLSRRSLYHNVEKTLLKSIYIQPRKGPENKKHNYNFTVYTYSIA